MAEDILFCTICNGRIPEGRMTRQTATCSEPCKDKLDAMRARQRANRKCPHCLHPSSPEEREEFRLWRIDRRDVKQLKESRGNGMVPKAMMVNTMKVVNTFLSKEVVRMNEELLTAEPADLPALKQRLEKFTSLVIRTKESIPTPVNPPASSPE
jgi:predicted nucleic acid-binding Zn ribbon protein